MTAFIESYRRGDVAVVVVVGNLDGCVARPFRKALMDAVEAGSDVVVDLDRVTVMETPGLAPLAGALRRLRSRGRRLDVVCGSPVALEALTSTHLHKVFTVHSTIDSYVTSRLPVQSR